MRRRSMSLAVEFVALAATVAGQTPQKKFMGGPVTIASWNNPTSLLGLVNGAAVGTRVVPQSVREPAAAPCAVTPWSDLL